jgi:hypothetical protein
MSKSMTVGAMTVASGNTAVSGANTSLPQTIKKLVTAAFSESSSLLK